MRPDAYHWILGLPENSLVKIESNGEVVKHALQAQELSNRTQATLLKAQLNAMFIF